LEPEVSSLIRETEEGAGEQPMAEQPARRKRTLPGPEGIVWEEWTLLAHQDAASAVEPLDARTGDDEWNSGKYGGLEREVMGTGEQKVDCMGRTTELHNRPHLLEQIEAVDHPVKDSVGLGCTNINTIS
jgi:hypothetical protein